MNYAFRHGTASFEYQKLHFLWNGILDWWRCHNLPYAHGKRYHLEQGKKFPLQLIILAGIKILIWERNTFLSLSSLLF
jgi:hypothetical protein